MNRIGTDMHASVVLEAIFNQGAFRKLARTALAVLETQQRELETELSLFIYPVLSLSTEIISRILVACLPSDGFVRPSPSEPPLTLAQVCSLGGILPYRRAGLGFFIVRLYHRNTSVDVRHPLSLSLFSSHDGLPEEILSLISSVPSQLDRLDLRLSFEDFDYLRENPTSFPTSKVSLYIDHFYSGMHASESWISIVENAPTLCDLEVGGLPPSFSDLQRYRFLHTIELEIISVQTLVDILNRLPRLLHLTAILDRLIGGSLPVTTAPYLQSLPLVGDLQTLVISALDSLKLPGLRCLFLELRPYSTLPHLLHPAQLMQCLRSIPSLPSLAIYAENLPAVVEQMAIHPLLLPRLCTDDTANHDYLLLDLLRVRRNPSDPDATKLSLFQLHVEEDPFEHDWLRDDRILAKFSHLIAQGLKVELSYPDGSQWPLTQNDE
ncbi:hypothetical protein C8R44DRAFT_882776 [Mycena epipterygia]|nr:hypothetical protein C8R44DRAFT_882776 [Mycena epipterygia]